MSLPLDLAVLWENDLAENSHNTIYIIPISPPAPPPLILTITINVSFN